MKPNFKKVMSQTAISVGLVLGSMSAHAVISTVPAPAQLIPLFGYTDEGERMDAQGGRHHRDGVNSYVRVVVPKSVGLDTVIQLFGPPPLTPNPVDGTDIPQYGVNPALEDSATAKVHWIFLDKNSDEVRNGDFPVTPDDAMEFSAKKLPKTSAGFRPSIPANQWGYLLLVNETAKNGGDPLFVFSADAWLIAESDVGLPIPVQLPVLPLTDTKDPAGSNVVKVPTLTNNVVELFPNKTSPNLPTGYPYGNGAIASPIVSAIRVAVAGQDWIRTLDIPMQDKTGKGFVDKYFVAWSSQNNGLSGQLYSYDDDEGSLSEGSLSLPGQLNFVHVGDEIEYVGPLGFDVTANIQPGHSVDGGFIKWLLTAPYNAGAPDDSVYASAVVFTLPFEVFHYGHLDSVAIAGLRGDNGAQNVPLFANDRGFSTIGGN